MIPKIVIRKKPRSLDVVLYNMPNTKIVDWFALVDVYGERGTELHDGGLQFELPLILEDVIHRLPFVQNYGITVEQIFSSHNDCIDEFVAWDEDTYYTEEDEDEFF